MVDDDSDWPVAGTIHELIAVGLGKVFSHFPECWVINNRNCKGERGWKEEVKRPPQATGEATRSKSNSQVQFCELFNLQQCVRPFRTEEKDKPTFVRVDWPTAHIQHQFESSSIMDAVILKTVVVFQLDGILPDQTLLGDRDACEGETRK